MTISNEPLPNLLFEYAGADVILRSRDSHHLRVPKSYMVHCSPVLDELIENASNLPDDSRGNTSLASLPVVHLPESGAILHHLLTFIFPTTPLVPSTTEEAMELLSVAQKYQMVPTLACIRYHVAQQNPLSSTQHDDALHRYSLAQKYGLHQEAVQAAQSILMKYPMNFAEWEDKLDVIPGASLYELWNYYGKVQKILAKDISAFRKSGARGTLRDLRCVKLSSSEIPCWIDSYIASIPCTPNIFNLIEFNVALARHMGDKDKNIDCACTSISSQTICNFWESLMSVVHGSFKEAESALSLVRGREESQDQANLIASQVEPLDVPDASLIIRSSDLVDFRVHKAVLAMASPFFTDLLSLPQPSESESVDGLPVVHLPEDAELLNSLVSMLYPIRPVIPDSYDKVLHLLAACQKYDMVQIQSSVRAEVNREGSPAPVGAEVFHAYAIASSKGLIPEMEKAACLTLDYPMTFGSLGEGLRLFEGSALRDLARFRKRYRDNLATCLTPFLKVNHSRLLKTWSGCPDFMPRGSPETDARPALPTWLRQFLSQCKNNSFAYALTTPSSIREKYSWAINTHTGCKFCLWAHKNMGPKLCADLEKRLTQAQDKALSDL